MLGSLADDDDLNPDWFGIAQSEGSEWQETAAHGREYPMTNFGLLNRYKKHEQPYSEISFQTMTQDWSHSASRLRMGLIIMHWVPLLYPHAPKMFDSSWKVLNTCIQMPQAGSWSSPSPPIAGTQAAYLGLSAPVHLPFINVTNACSLFDYDDDYEDRTRFLQRVDG